MFQHVHGEHYTRGPSSSEVFHQVTFTGLWHSVHVTHSAHASSVLP